MEAVLTIWKSGGWVMIPLFSLAALLYAQAFLLILLARDWSLSTKTSVHWWDWVRNPANAEGRVREVLEYTQDGAQSRKQVMSRFDEIRRGLIEMLDRRVIFVSMLVAAAPLLGLLGTVLGMLQTFLGISTSGGTETAGVVAAGISEALVTTQTGLTIALPGLFVVMLIQRRKHQLAGSLSRLESLTLAALKLDADGDPRSAGKSQAEAATQTAESTQARGSNGGVGQWHDAA